MNGCRCDSIVMQVRRMTGQNLQSAAYPVPPQGPDYRFSEPALTDKIPKPE